MKEKKDKMNQQELEKVKQKALQDHIPIIMDDTLEVMGKILNKSKPERILEIGTAVRLFCYVFYLLFSS